MVQGGLGLDNGLQAVTKTCFVDVVAGADIVIELTMILLGASAM
jgi:hypothetical protein